MPNSTQRAETVSPKASSNAFRAYYGTTCLLICVISEQLLYMCFCVGPGAKMSGLSVYVLHGHKPKTTPQKSLSVVRNTFRARLISTNLFAVFRVGEVNEVVIVHLLGVDNITVLLLTQVLGVDAIGSQELLVSYAERLADGLGD